MCGRENNAGEGNVFMRCSRAERNDDRSLPKFHSHSPRSYNRRPIRRLLRIQFIKLIHLAVRFNVFPSMHLSTAFDTPLDGNE